MSLRHKKAKNVHKIVDYIHKELTPGLSPITSHTCLPDTSTVGAFIPQHSRNEQGMINSWIIRVPSQSPWKVNNKDNNKTYNLIIPHETRNWRR